MKAHIQYKKVDGSDGVALMPSAVTSLDEAKRQLAAKLDLPPVEGIDGNEGVDARLQQGGVLPETVAFSRSKRGLPSPTRLSPHSCGRRDSPWS